MKSGFDNWSDVRVFLAVLRTGSTLAASRSLGLAQPTVARRVDALEHTLGLTLFERDTRGFHPTAQAVHLRPLAEALEAAAMAFEEKADRERRYDMRSIRITAPKANFSVRFAAILSDFRAEHPDVQFEFVPSDRILDLVAGDADVAVRIARSIDDPRLICRKMTQVTGSLYASRAYAEKYGVPSSPDDLAGHSYVVYDGRRTTLGVNEWLVDRIAPEWVVSRCDDPDSMFTAIRTGLGIGPLATSLARDDGTLVRCFPPPEGTSAFSWLVMSPLAWQRPQVKEFARFFVPRFRAIFARPDDDPKA